MRRTFKIISILAIFLWVTCTVKEGEITGFKPSFGSIFVSTTVPNARIFLDHKDTGLITPALVNDVHVGRHVVHIFLSNYSPPDYKDSIVVEVIEGKETSVSFELTNVPNVGNLRVLSNPDSALVLLNKLEFGYTPLAVNGLLAGEHSVGIRKAGYAAVQRNVQVNQNQTTEVSETLSLKRLVLFEHYSNTYCIPCVDVDVIIEDVVHQLGPFELISLGYHPPIPGPADPFYLAAKPENDARRNYYSVPFSPYAIIDGVKIINTTSLSQLEQNILSAVDERRQILPKAILEFFDFKTVVDTISGRVKVTALENLGTSAFLRIALIERTIDTAQPQGSNGQTHFFDVLRDFNPSVAGVSIQLSANQKQSVKFEFVRDVEWGDDLDVIAFLQDDATKEVLQAIWTAD
jgi:hypothetical protein